MWLRVCFFELKFTETVVDTHQKVSKKESALRE